MSQWHDALGRLLLSLLGWALLTVGAALVSFAAWAGMPYWRGESCTMALMGFVVALPVGVPMMVGGALVLLGTRWSGRGAVQPQARVTVWGRIEHRAASIASIVVSVMLVLVGLYTLGSSLFGLLAHGFASLGLALGALLTLGGVSVLVAEDRRRSRGRVE